MDKQTFRKNFFGRYRYDSICKLNTYWDCGKNETTLKLGDILEVFVQTEKAGYEFEEEFHYRQTPWFVEISFLKIKRCFLFKSEIKERISFKVTVLAR